MLEYPFDVEWTIAEERLNAFKNSINNEYLQSKKFTVIPSSNVLCFIRLYPNGDNDEDRGMTWIYFHLDLGKETKIEAAYKLSIKSAYNSRKYNIVFTKSRPLMCFLPCPMVQLFEEFIVDGKLIVKVKGILKVEKAKPLWKTGKNFGDLWNMGFEDFMLVADGKGLRVHKNVLACQSPVFSAMFKLHTKEAMEGRVVITDFPYNIVEKAMKICYQVDLDPDTSISDALLLLKFVDKYDISVLKDNLENHLADIIDTSNVCEVAQSATDGNALNLRNKCLEYFMACLTKKELVPNMELLDKNFFITAVTKLSSQKFQTL